MSENKQSAVSDQLSEEVKQVLNHPSFDFDFEHLIHQGIWVIEDIYGHYDGFDFDKEYKERLVEMILRCRKEVRGGE